MVAVATHVKQFDKSVSPCIAAVSCTHGDCRQQSISFVKLQVQTTAHRSVIYISNYRPRQLVRVLDVGYLQLAHRYSELSSCFV